MDLIKLTIPASFIESRTALSWKEVLFGLENELLDPRAAIAVALSRCAESDRPPAHLLELAAAREHEGTRSLVEHLAESEPVQNPDKIRCKWLYLVLAWVYEHRGAYKDPLRVVEEVYADFGYPQNIAPFVRYMPSDAPDLGSREANEGRLLEKWRRFLDDERPTY